MAIEARIHKLANIVVGYSLKVKRGENVVISGSTEASDFIIALHQAIIKKGAHPILRLTLPGLSSFFFKYAQRHQLENYPKIFDYTVKNSQKYIGVDTEFNTKELSGIHPKKITLREKITQKITNYIVNRRDKIWRCTVGFPCVSLAQEAEMSASDFEDFVFSACLQNWKKLGQKIDKILKKFRKGKEVHLIGQGIDLKFEIRGDKAQADKGEENMPGGEIYMAPFKKTVEGFVKFDFPAVFTGQEVDGIYLEFKNGKVIKATATKNETLLKAMIATDKNASYLGEFGIGCNPKIKRFTKNLLFDEKIGGTIHLALGMAYKDNGGGNDSAIHWDMVKNMSKAKIILDGKIVQQNGKFKI